MENNRAWIYCRTASPDSQGLIGQQSELELYAEKHELEIVGITAEHASGIAFPRRGLIEVYKAVVAGQIDVLLVTELARLSRTREVLDFCLRWLEDLFVDVVCADGTLPRTCAEILHDLCKGLEK